MPLSKFHPAVEQWFASAFAAPTEAQRLGWPAIQSGEDTLIAAPTGSGKTLAAFLCAIDALIRQGTLGAIPDQLEVVYISPLKALSNDVKVNLAVPLAGVERTLEKMGLPAPEIRVWVRTGDTPAAERQKMLRKPPHILVTTPESLYILLTAEKSRRLFGSVRTVIVDEIHAVARDKRGSHLALSLERLDALAVHKPVRIGLSATQSPIEEVARFLVGTRRIVYSAGHAHGHGGGAKEDGRPRCTIVNTGHSRPLRLAIEVPSQPLSAVCSNETWEEIYDRIATLIRGERTTLVFVNTRRLAERVSMHLAKRLGEDKVTAHHGSMSRRQRFAAESRLKAGALQALVATASLELGIDIGTVDLVCQIGSTRAIATLLQRVGRSGHTLGAVPQGRIFAMSRDELVECAALMRAVKRGKLDRLRIPEKPLDILAQQMIAATAAEEWSEDGLYELCRGAYPYRNLTRAEFDELVLMLAEGFSTRRGRSGAHLHYDAVRGRLRPRKGARLAAIMSGGAIPDTADYQVVLEPEGSLVGTVNEDFAIESMAGDIFQLGSASWRILRVETGVMRVEDAHGEPPTIPFWLGEAPARTAELSQEISELREEVGERIDDGTALAWLKEETGMGDAEAVQIVEYLAAARRALGVVPTQKTVVLERFFDATGGMQLVVHAPFGARINRAWGLSLRKRFCRNFNFELQAAATDDAIVLSLGLQHSFPLEDVFSYLHSKSAEELLVQALIAAPMFQTRWRWNAGRALAIQRNSGGKKVPAAILRMRADDLLSTVFPDSTACAENLSGPIQIPTHPLVRQTIEDCLTEAMDRDGFLALLGAMESGKLRLVARDTTEPSPLAHEILNAKPYAFLDDAPLEERRARAVQMRRTLDFPAANEMGELDPASIQKVRNEARPEAESPDELHDALMLAGFASAEERPEWQPHFDVLAAQGRAACLSNRNGAWLWVATERKAQFDAVYFGTGVMYRPAIEAPRRGEQREWKKDEALVEIVRGRMEILGPVTAQNVAGSMGLAASEIETALAALEREGSVFRGHFSGAAQEEWCDRRLLARIHRATLDRLRKEIEPVTAAEFMRFLFAWQHADPEFRLEGPLGLSAIVGMLQGYEISAAAWEAAILPARMVRYDPAWLDQLCLSGELSWTRLFLPNGTDGKRPGGANGANRASPISLVFRDQMDAWLALARGAEEGNGEQGIGRQVTGDRLQVTGKTEEGTSADFADGADDGRKQTGGVQIPRRSAPRDDKLIEGREAASAGTNGNGMGANSAIVLGHLQTRGACFFQELVAGTRLLRTEVESALRELIAAGYVTADGFAALRALVIAPDKALGTGTSKHKDGRVAGVLPVIPPSAGRWSVVRIMDRSVSGTGVNGNGDAKERESKEGDTVSMVAWQLLRRYGVVFYKLVERESGLPPWRELLYRLRRLEARGEIRGGRFVAGFSGEQYALPEAIQELRAIRRRAPSGMLVAVSGADPLNLAGITTPGVKIAGVATNRVLYRDGIPIAAREAGQVVELHASAAEMRKEIEGRLK